MGDLRVELYGELVGTLVAATGDFVAHDAAIKRFGLNSTILSLAIPLGSPATTASRQRARNFFSELLPEGDQREALARQAGLAEDDVVGLLRVYGRDVAGALQIWDPESPGEPSTPALQPLSEADVRTLLEDVSRTPLGNKPADAHGRRGKTSLPGVQTKIVLVRTPDGWAQALDGYPSTHIVKPIVPRYPSMIFDEEYGSRFARRLQLAGFATTLEAFAGLTALVIERYDRSPDIPQNRVHQEDFNQVLGLSKNQKYERYAPDRRRGLGEVASHLGRQDRRTLARMVVLSVALGNLDLHAKNISLLHLLDGRVELAPMYDVVPQTFQPNDGEMAFSINGEFEHRLLTREHLVAELAGWGMRSPMQLISEVLVDARRIADEERPHPAAHPGLQHVVIGIIDNLLAGRAAGDDGSGTFHAPLRTERADRGGWAWANPVQDRAPVPESRPGEVWVGPHIRRGRKVDGHWRSRRRPS
ncbi:type II toxin-antitoxin system HipA family toxin [Microbacterium rhizophilus]|uniref:type II toxin-antitoxin system HipA family toxin n=1 Tax=Microbacterium rhizophilus TaxID=3138934 RepID=UPI0031E6EA84